MCLCKECAHTKVCMFKDEYNKVVKEITLIKDFDTKNLYTVDIKCRHYQNPVILTRKL